MNINYIKQTVKRTMLGKWLISLRYRHPSEKPHFSYSQTGEDLILSFFLKNKKSGFYIDVGAYHPVHLSNTYSFYLRNWSGITVEPNPAKFYLFEKQRPRDINLNIGVGEDGKKAKLFVFDADTLSTFSEEAAEECKKIGHSIVATKEVTLMSLEKIIEKYAPNKTIDFLSVDTEGYDLEVLKTNDWDRFRPRLVVLETVEYGTEVFGKKLNVEYDAFMDAIGYKKVADTYINTIYLDTHISLDNH